MCSWQENHSPLSRLFLQLSFANLQTPEELIRITILRKLVLQTTSVFLLLSLSLSLSLDPHLTETEGKFILSENLGLAPGLGISGTAKV